MLSDFIVEKNNSLPKDENEITSIAINYRSIKIVDYLPYTFTKITELYLNHNLIVSVVGLKQFKFLNVCELKFNYIEKMNEFEHLKELKKLERLNLTGNPIEKSEKFSFHFFKSIFPKYYIEKYFIIKYFLIKNGICIILLSNSLDFLA